MADDGLREFRLRGKHLVSLFMASAVLLVFVFLCGVLVGRGVRAQKEPAMPRASAASGAAAEDPTAPLVPGQPVAKTSSQAPPPTSATPPPVPEDELSYYSRLDGKPTPPGSAKPAAGARREGTPAAPAKPVEAAPRQAAAPVTPPAAPTTAAKTTPLAPPPQKPAAPVTQKPAAPVTQKPAAPVTQKPAAATPQKPATLPAAKPAAAAASSDPPGPGYVVKIVAYRDKAQSDALVARLVAKGYAAYVVTVAGKGAPLFSVRVGRFKERADADAARRRLEKEEQFKPLITR